MASLSIAKNMRQLLEDYTNLRGANCKMCSESNMWSLVVITTADEEQREAFEQQVKDKYDRRELPVDLPIHVVSDPPGPKIGNGGSTLTALEFLHSVYGEELYQKKTLLIHAGGWSQRMPNSTILGKIFTAIPHGEPVFQMLDLKLALYLPLVTHLPAGIFLACADDLLVYDLGVDDSWSLPNTGFIALAHPSPLNVGRTHGVYVVDRVEDIDVKKPVVVANCLQVLQKPSDELMTNRGALLKSENKLFEFAGDIHINGDVVYTDSCFFMSVDVMKKLLELKKAIGVISCEIDAYGDFLQALGPQATDDYIYNTANISEITSDLIQVRKQVFGALQGCDITLLIINSSKFIHIGTTQELLHHFCQDKEFQFQMALKTDCFNYWQLRGRSQSENKESTEPGDTSIKQIQGCVMHSVLPWQSTVASSSVVEYCHFDIPVIVEGNSIVSNCQWLLSDCQALQSLVVPSEIFLHTVCLVHSAVSYYVTIFFKISNNLKSSFEPSDVTNIPFLNKTVGFALKYWQLAESVVLPELNRGNRKISLWTLKLYPGTRTMTESLALTLDMIFSVQNECSLTTVLKLKPLDSVFFSLSDALSHKNIGAMLDFRRQLYNQIQTRHV